MVMSALDTLKALSQKKPAEQKSALVTQMTDPALAGAQRNKSTVKLGLDPAVTHKAREAAELHERLQEAEVRYAIVQAEIRAYGAEKRELYNKTFKSDVTTVAVPYSVESDSTTDTPGRETRYVSVVCTNRYSVQSTTLLALRDAGSIPQFDELFTTETVRKLKPNAEQLVRGLLEENGIRGEDLENAMDTLFDVETKVSASKDYERRVENVSDDVRLLLSQCVRRVEPSLKM